VSYPGGSLLAQQQIDHEAAPNLVPRLAAVVQDVSVAAAGVFEGVGQDGQAVEGAVGVEGLVGDTRARSWR
jgi:hypothetical protein